MSLGHCCSVCKGKSSPWWTRVQGGQSQGSLEMSLLLLAVRDCLCYLCEIILLLFASTFSSFPLRIGFFFCLGSVRDVISVASSLIIIIDVVCTGSPEEGCGSQGLWATIPSELPRGIWHWKITSVEVMGEIWQCWIGKVVVLYFS